MTFFDPGWMDQNEMAFATLKRAMLKMRVVLAAAAYQGAWWAIDTVQE